MAKLKRKLTFESAFDVYVTDELLGEGGSGQVYAAVSSDGTPVAIKVLSAKTVSRDKRARFKNEIGFLEKTIHPNIVNVLDYGTRAAGEASDPFYVMPRFEGSLRDLMRTGIKPHEVLPLFIQALDGIEAAHLLGVFHRDIKPENILYTDNGSRLAVADFGIAHFNEDALVTMVETSPAQRLANFQYAAPEQRIPGGHVGYASDIYALGLMLNELFTGHVPHGTDFTKISSISSNLGYLDQVVDGMIRQKSVDRFESVRQVKTAIESLGQQAISHQKLSELSKTVVPASAIDDSLAFAPPILVGADWNGHVLTLQLDRTVNQEWLKSLREEMSSYTSVPGKGPGAFSFKDKTATIQAEEHEVQPIIDYFKSWLPKATTALKHRLEWKAKQDEEARRTEIRRAQEAEERRLRVLQSIRI